MTFLYSDLQQQQKCSTLWTLLSNKVKVISRKQFKILKVVIFRATTLA